MASFDYITQTRDRLKYFIKTFAEKAVFYLPIFQQQKKRLAQLINFIEMSLRTSPFRERFYKIVIMDLFSKPLRNTFEEVRF